MVNKHICWIFQPLLPRMCGRSVSILGRRGWNYLHDDAEWQHCHAIGCVCSDPLICRGTCFSMPFCVPQGNDSLYPSLDWRGNQKHSADGRHSAAVGASTASVYESASSLPLPAALGKWWCGTLAVQPRIWSAGLNSVLVRSTSCTF